jgi:mannose-6-phosphate isomerase-like protein (cupin superfamily)
MKNYHTSTTKEIIAIWSEYLKDHDWRLLIEGREPQFKLGPVIYQIPKPFDRPNESFSIADMRDLRMEQVSPHYHDNGEIEIHFVVEGHGLVIVGGEEIQLKKGDVVVVPSHTAHYTIPDGLVLGVVNTPPFDSHNNVGLAELTESKPEVGFDYDQFKRLTAVS